MQKLSDFLKDAATDCGLSYAEISRQVGKGAGYFSELVRSSKPREPGALTFIKLCQVLNISPNDYSPVEPKISFTSRSGSKVERMAARLMAEVTREAMTRNQRRGRTPAIDDVLLWWHQNSGRLSAYDNFSDCVDIYHRPDPNQSSVAPSKVGKQSLASRAFSVNSEPQLQSIIRELGRDLNKKIVASYARTSTGQPLLTREIIDFQSSSDVRARFSYQRLLLPVTDQEGGKFVMNFSRYLG